MTKYDKLAMKAGRYITYKLQDISELDIAGTQTCERVALRS